MPGPPESFASLLRSRRGYLGTTGPDSTPHVLPVCFTWAGDVIWTATDGKPKATRALQRLADIGSNARVSFLVDRWDEDWSRIAWLQAQGRARQALQGAEAQKVKVALRGKYAQYADSPLEGPVLRIDVDRWLTWEAS